MKRLAILAISIIGALSVAYIALHLYARLTAPRMSPGEPIEIYRDPDAPKYSALRRRFDPKPELRRDEMPA